MATPQDKELRIRVSASDDPTVAATYNRLIKGYKAVKEDTKEPIFLNAEFREQVIVEGVKAALDRAQKEADKKKIRIEAEVLAREVKHRAFGEPSADEQAKTQDDRRRIVGQLADEGAGRAKAAGEDRATDQANKQVILQQLFDQNSEQVEKLRIQNQITDEQTLLLRQETAARAARAVEQQDLRNAEARMTKEIRAASREAVTEADIRRKIVGELTEQSLLEEERTRFLATQQKGATATGGHGAREGAESPEGGGEEDFGGGLAGGVRRLRATFGRFSTFGGLAQIVRGTGPIIGLGLAARTLEHYAGSFEAVSKEIRNSDLSAGQVLDKIARVVPILGSIYSAGRSIREVFTGENAELEKTILNAQEIKQNFEFVQKIIASSTDEVLRLRRATADFDIQRRTVGTTGFGAEDAQALRSAEERRLNVLAESASVEERIRKETLDKRAELNERLNKLYEKYGKIIDTAQGARSEADRRFAENQLARVGVTSQLENAAKQRDAIGRAEEGAIKRIESEKAETLKGADELTTRETEARDLRQGQQRMRLKLEIERQTNQAIFDRRQSQMRAFEGDPRAQRQADIEAVRFHRDEAIDALRERRDKEVEEDSGHRNEIRYKFRNLELAIIAKALSDEHQIVTRHDYRLEDQEYDHQKRVADIQEEARVNRLRALGLDDEAEREQREKQFEDRIQEIRRQADIEKRIKGADVAGIDRRAKEDIEAEKQRFQSQAALDLREQTRRAASVQLPELVESRFLTGAAQASRDKTSAELINSAIRNAQEAAAHALDVHFDDLARWINDLETSILNAGETQPLPSGLRGFIDDWLAKINDLTVPANAAGVLPGSPIPPNVQIQINDLLDKMNGLTGARWNPGGDLPPPTNRYGPTPVVEAIPRNIAGDDFLSHILNGPSIRKPPAESSIDRLGTSRSFPGGSIVSAATSDMGYAKVEKAVEKAQKESRDDVVKQTKELKAAITSLRDAFPDFSQIVPLYGGPNT